VDRALNAEHLETALGGGVRGLPSARELATLLANAEAALFRGAQDVDDDVLATGWYLHSVGSALPALELYGVERQRAAFQVAGHIFDLALSNETVDEVDRLRMTFAAQVANIRGQLDPNALAAYRWRVAAERAVPRFQDSKTPLDVGTAVLGFDTRWQFPALQHLRSDLTSAQESWRIDLRSTLFGSCARVIDGSWALLLYLVYGDPANLDAARVAFREGATFDHPAADLDARWVAFHLWQLCDFLGPSSLWSILPPDAPRSLARAFTMSRPPVLTLWPPQVNLLSRDRRPYALDPDVKRMVLSVPTSAGKTLLAQLLSADHVLRRGTGVCFVAPTRSLCREIEATLRARMRMIVRAEDVIFSDWMFVAGQDPEPTVEVMTPERLAYLMRLDPDAVLARFGLFVIDEAHSVGDVGRGWTLEWVLSTLHERTRDTAHRIVAMSAALGNQGVLGLWLDPAGAGVQFVSDWRGPRRVHAIYTTSRDDNSATPVPRTRTNSPERTRYDLKGVLHLRPTATGQTQRLETTAPIGTLVVRTANFTRDVGLSTPFYKTLAPLARILGRAGPVLLISPTKVEAARLAVEIADSIAAQDGPQWLAEVAAARLGAGHRLVGCLRRGVAFHHSSLPSDILLGIEAEVVAGTLKYVVATTTLTEGVNLPVRTVVIAAQGSYGPEGYREFIIGARLLNAIGRAGRAGKESEGWIVLARNAAFAATDFARLAPTEADIPIRSTLAAEEALEQLAVLEAAIARGADVALARAGQLVEDFLSFVWYIASVADEGDNPAIQDQVEATLQSTLAWTQLDAPSRGRYLGVALLALEAYAERPPRSRRRWSRAGTSIGTAIVLDGIGGAVAQSLMNDPTVADSATDVLSLIAGDGRLEQLLALPEARIEHPRNQRGGTGTHVIDLDHLGLLLGWVAGNDVQDLANRFLHEVTDEEFRLEELSDFVTSAFENFLPWALGLIVDWANESLRENGGYDGPQLPQSVSAFVRCGVDNEDAVRLIRAGLVSRPLASAVSAEYRQQREGPEQTLRAWLCTSDISDWRARFGASPLDLRTLLEIARPTGTRLAAEIMSGNPVTISVRPVAQPRVANGLEMRPAENEPAPAPIGLWLGSDLYASILPENLADVEVAVATGVPIDVSLDVVDDSQVATLRLATLQT
jgi:hypothetical protein